MIAPVTPSPCVSPIPSVSDGIDKSQATEKGPPMPIAIIGMACRFPGDATSPERLWDLCANARSAWSPIPSSRFNQAAWYHPDREHMGTSYVKGAHFLTEDISRFDASFFNLSFEAASTMDPEVRLQLETVYEALENAGIPLEKAAGTRTGVFAGTCFRDNHDSLMRDPDTLARFYLTGNGAAMIANRVSHFYDLRGPSLMVDTGCSTTLTLLHLACQSLRAGESSMAVVGGSNLLLNPDMFISGTNLSLLSAEGKCFAFDSRASGYGRGDGVASIIIKPLHAALRDGDPVRAVIRNTAANQDGKTDTLTSPSQEAQQALIQECYQSAGLSPCDTAFVEAHGTGTQAGDTVEAHALGTVFADRRKDDQPLLIGSVKTNIGHTEATSGLAGIIKAVIALEKGAIPPHLNYESPNKNISLEALKLKIPLALQPWPSYALRRASVNNFGYGGANAHVIIEDPQYLALPSLSKPLPFTPSSKARSRVFILSAKDQLVAGAMVSRLRKYVSAAIERSDPLSSEVLLDQLAFTLGQRRTRFAWTVACSANSLLSLHSTLESNNLTPQRTLQAPRLGMVFTGQGAQWYAMGRELLYAYPVFREAIEEVDEHLRAMGATWSAMEELQRDAANTRINLVSHSLPLSVAIQLALINLLRSWGINPTGVTGHSSGEVSAAYAAGAISMSAAVAIVYTRGDLTCHFQQLLDRHGGMVAVGLGREDAQAILSRVHPSKGSAVIACINSPGSVTISGDKSAIEEVEAILAQEQVFYRRLKVDAAYHSPHMIPIADSYRQMLSQFLEPPPEPGNAGDNDNIIYSSPTTGGRMSSKESLASPEHWVQNMLQPVEFLDSLRNLCVDTAHDGSPCSVDILIEVGPHGALAGPIRQTLQLSELQEAGITYESCLMRGQDAVHTMHSLVSSLVKQGYPVDMAAVNFPSGHRGISVLTDSPTYPWNHETSYWAEPRINRELRTRAFVPHDLLGVPTHDSTPLIPSWRHVIRPQDIPWVRDHIIQGLIIYPGAGYISMIIEAFRQIATGNDSSVASSASSPGYRLQDIQIRKPLILSEDSAVGVEVRLSMRPSSDLVLKSHGWYDFQIQSVDSHGTWMDHCDGQCSISTLTTGNGWTGPKFIDPEMEDQDEYGKGCWQSIDPTDTYKELRAVGVNHGPIFQNLISAQGMPGRSITTFEVAHTAASMPYQHEHPHLLHPTTLDSIFQAAYHNLSAGGSHLQTAMIPTAIKSLFISSSLSSSPGHRFQTRSSLVKFSPHGFESTVRVINAGATSESHQTPLLRIDGLFCQSLGAATTVKNEQQPKLCYNTTWKPDIDFIEATYFSPSASTSTETGQDFRFSQLQEAAVVLLSDTLRDISPVTISPEHQAYFVWLQSLIDEAQVNGLDLNGVSAEYIAHLTLDLEQTTAGSLLVRFARALPHFLSGRDVDSQPVREDYELYLPTWLPSMSHPCTSDMQKLLDLYGHKFPRSKILEIGNGTVHTSRMILDALTTGMECQFSSYDLATSDLDNMDALMKDDVLKPFDGRLNFKTYHPNDSPEDQGFSSNSYDLIIISTNALWAASDIQQTLCHIRSLLKSGGKLLIFGPSIQDLTIQMILRLIPGWKGDSNIKMSRNVLLEKAGFDPSALQVIQRSATDPYLSEVVMASVMTEKNMAQIPPPEITLVYSTVPPPIDWIQALRSVLLHKHKSYTLSVRSFAENVNTEDGICVFLDDLVGPILHDPTPEQFNTIRQLLSVSVGVLWVSQGSQGHTEQPWSSLHHGLFRTLRCENSTKQYISLDLDPTSSSWTLESAELIAYILHTKFYGPPLDLMETEYHVRAGLVHISRVHDNEYENQAVIGSSTLTEPEMKPFIEAKRSIRLGVTTPGLLNSLTFSDDPTADEPLPDDYVEIEPRAFGLNFRDIMVALGQLDETRMGFECSGVISHAGPKAQAAGFTPGSRVYAFIIGYFATSVRIPYTSVAPIPEGMDFPTAASIPLVFITAYHALYDLARLKPGETVLIHSGTGGVGQAAIMLAQAANAEVFVTVGSEEKRDFLIDHYGIPRSRIFSSRNVSFADHIMQATNGKGVDVVLNSLAGPYLRQTWRCIGTFGRFIEIGKRDIEQNSMVEMGPFVRSVTFAALDLITLGERRGPEVARIFGEINALLAAGRVRPVSPIKTFSMSEVEKAFRYMQTGKHMGKIILQPQPDDIVKVLPSTPQPVCLPSDATYVIVGGLGGIRKSVSQLLVDRGARHLILLSRSASTLDCSSEEFVSSLRAKGTTVSLQSCDIANADQVKATFDNYVGKMPPIKGVIQAAMVLRDCIFEQMTWDDYMAAVRPKVQGSWNLHTLLPGLDFFILLSSISGFGGNAGQANYAAGGSFQDALARYRAGRGLPAVSIDLGMVSSVGFVSKTQQVADHLTKLGLRAVSEMEVLGLVESAIRNPCRTPCTCQVVTGIPRGFTRSSSTVFWNYDSRFSNLEQVNHGSALGSDPNTVGNHASLGLKEKLAASATLDHAIQLVERAFITKLADMFSRPEYEIDPNTPLSQFGVDSLVAVELRNWLATAVKSECSIFDVMHSVSVTELAAKATKKSKLFSGE